MKCGIFKQKSYIIFRNRGRGQKDRLEKTRGEEEEIHNQVQSEQIDGEDGESEKEEKAFSPPEDASLCEYIKEVRQLVQDLQTVKDQVSAIALWVDGFIIDWSLFNRFIFKSTFFSM